MNVQQDHEANDPHHHPERPRDAAPRGGRRQPRARALAAHARGAGAPRCVAVPSRTRGGAFARRWRAALTLVALGLLALGLLDCEAFGGCPLPEQHRYYCSYCVHNSRISGYVYVCANSEATAQSAAEAQLGVNMTSGRNAPECDLSIARPPPPLHPEGEGGSDVCGAAGGAGGIGGSSDIGTGVGASSDVGGVGAGPSSSDVGAGAGPGAAVGAGGFGERKGRGGAGGAGGAP
jgi:hypothetical protein